MLYGKFSWGNPLPKNSFHKLLKIIAWKKVFWEGIRKRIKETKLVITSQMKITASPDVRPIFRRNTITATTGKTIVS